MNKDRPGNTNNSNTARKGFETRVQGEVTEGLFHRVKLTEAEENLKSILKNQLLFEQSPLDETIFLSDLVIQLQVPTHNYISRSEKMQLGSILRKFPKTLLHAYESAYQDLFVDMELVGDDTKQQQNNDKQLLIRQFASFQSIQQTNQNGIEDQGMVRKEKKAILDDDDLDENIGLNCIDEYTGILDSFILNYNCLIYSLQQLCGFNVKAFVTTEPSQKMKNVGFKKMDPTSLQMIEYIQAKSEGLKRKIFIFLYLSESQLIKAANKYKIKKEIQYTLIDPFLNDPMDSNYRPLRYNSQVKTYLTEKGQEKHKEQLKIQKKKKSKIITLLKKKSKRSGRETQSEQSITVNESDAQESAEFRRRKTIDRKIGLNLPDHDKATSIIQEKDLNDSEIKKFLSFTKQLDVQLQKLVTTGKQREGEKNYSFFNDPQDQDAITFQEKDYLYRINRFKYNLGVEKKYIQKKKQRKYFQILKEASKKYGYDHFEAPTLFAQFRLANKNSKFFNRLERILIYKQQIVGPNGELSLFNKMQRIKLTYSVLRETVRIQNLYMINSSLLALTDDYQKFGIIASRQSSKFHYQYQPYSEQDKSKLEKQKNMLKQNRSSVVRKGKQQNQKGIYGGLNGRNLQQDWHTIRIWKTVSNTIRNYLGESKTLQILVKTCIIYLFFFLTPLGILFQVLKQVIIAPKASSAGYLPEFWFYLGYLLAITIVYAIFSQKFSRTEQNYIKNFVQQNPTVQFLNQYRGPYSRDIQNDSANTYDSKYVAILDRIRTYAVFTVIFMIVGVEIGYYYGMRAAIVDLSYHIPEYDTTKFYLLRPLQLIIYSIFFISNAIFYRYCVIPLAHYLTKKQNRPTKQAFRNSQNLKLYIFCIGLELIGPIDLVFIQYSAKTSCSADWCLSEFEAYVYCRYMLILFFVIMSAFNMAFKYFRNKIQFKMQQRQRKNQQLTFSVKLAHFLQFVYLESRKQQCADIRLVDQTVALIHFSTFLSVFPLAPTISFVYMLIDYNVDRLQILKNSQRIIPKSQKFQTYRKIVMAVGHWMLFFNFAYLFIILEWLEYLFQNIVYAVLVTPTPSSMMTLKYAVIILFMLLYEIFMRFVMLIVRQTHSILDKRKWNMFQKFGIRSLYSGTNIVLKQPKPINSISRTFNLKKNVKQILQKQEDEGFQTKGPLVLKKSRSINRKGSASS